MSCRRRELAFRPESLPDRPGNRTPASRRRKTTTGIHAVHVLPVSGGRWQPALTCYASESPRSWRWPAL
eukprot:8196060-Pyramimonas_sp.AAC.1